MPLKEVSFALKWVNQAPPAEGSKITKPNRASMDSKDIHQYVDDFHSLRPVIENTDSAIAEVALFVEETFGITLTDAEICRQNLGTHESLKNFLLNKLKGWHKCAESAE